MQRLISVGKTMEQSKPKGGFQSFVFLGVGHGQTGSAASKVCVACSHNSSLGGISPVVGGGFVVADLIRSYTGG